jgi:hypothetical protein
VIVRSRGEHGVASTALVWRGCLLTLWFVGEQNTVPPASEDAQARTARFLGTLQQLLALDADSALDTALDSATGLIGQALDADMVNAFLYEPSTLVFAKWRE